MSYKNCEQIALMFVNEKLPLTTKNYLVNQFCYNLPAVIKTGTNEEKKKVPSLLIHILENYNQEN